MVLVYRSEVQNGSIRAWLTTEHSQSCYGLPVLLISCNGREDVLGPGDLLPSGLLAVDLVRAFLAEGNPGGGRWGKRTANTLRLAGAFVRSMPPDITFPKEES